MKVWITLDTQLPLAKVGAAARRAEALGADCVAVADNAHDGILAAFAAIQATERINVATMAIVCFARSPMLTAVAAWDLQIASKGRFRLGLGPLVAPIMIQKYSVPWAPPAPRMREYIASLKAIFDCWQHDTPLDYAGQYYRFTRQASYNQPPKSAFPEMPIHLGVIGPKLTAVAGEMAGGIMTHPTNSSPDFLRERLLPNLRLGAERGDRSVEVIDVIVNPPLALGLTTRAIQEHREYWRSLLAILLSTPNYWPSLELFGCPETGAELRDLVRQNRWDKLVAKLDDKLLDRFVSSSSYSDLPELLASQYHGLASTVCLALPVDDSGDKALSKAIDILRAM